MFRLFPYCVLVASKRCDRSFPASVPLQGAPQTTALNGWLGVRIPGAFYQHEGAIIRYLGLDEAWLGDLLELINLYINNEQVDFMCRNMKPSVKPPRDINISSCQPGKAWTRAPGQWQSSLGSQEQQLREQLSVWGPMGPCGRSGRVRRVVLGSSGNWGGGGWWVIADRADHITRRTKRVDASLGTLLLLCATSLVALSRSRPAWC